MNVTIADIATIIFCMLKISLELKIFQETLPWLEVFEYKPMFTQHSLVHMECPAHRHYLEAAVV